MDDNNSVIREKLISRGAGAAVGLKQEYCLLRKVRGSLQIRRESYNLQ